jgi:hypothetical protein
MILNLIDLLENKTSIIDLFFNEFRHETKFNLELDINN